MKHDHIKKVCKFSNPFMGYIRNKLLNIIIALMAWNEKKPLDCRCKERRFLAQLRHIEFWEGAFGFEPRRMIRICSNMICQLSLIQISEFEMLKVN
jgi:hypothetical protein